MVTGGDLSSPPLRGLTPQPRAASNEFEARAWALLDEVRDPEIPSVSIVDLGIVRDVRASDVASVEVSLTPTYSGCPAIETIEHDAGAALQPTFAQVTVRSVLSPAWSSDFITPRGHARMLAAGIAPPAPTGSATFAHAARALGTMGSALPLLAQPAVQADPACPRCGAREVERIAQFGTTSCKSLWRCCACREPFDHFKAH